MGEFLKKVWQKIKSFCIWLFKQLKDKKNICIFIIVFLLLSSEIWFSYAMALITGNKWWWGIGSACWAFWLAPFTPFFPLCIAITFAVRKIVDKISAKRGKNTKKQGESTDESGTSTTVKANRTDNSNAVVKKEFAE